MFFFLVLSRFAMLQTHQTLTTFLPIKMIYLPMIPQAGTRTLGLFKELLISAYQDLNRNNWLKTLVTIVPNFII